MWLGAAFVVIGIPLLLVRVAIVREPGDWHWKDWVGQLTQILTGVIFFGLAWFIGRKSEQRSEAMANAELITSMGALSITSARSYAGHDAQALRIAADARAALQHYPRAVYEEQHKLTEKVTDAYSDLIFGTFSRAGGLPRSIADGLRDGALDVVADAEVLARTASRRQAQRAELLRMADHIRFAVRLGDRVRSSGEAYDTELGPGGHRSLEKVWCRPDGEPCTTGERLALLELLYRRELTVVHDWKLLQRKEMCLHCEVNLYDVEDSSDWFAPWYVMRGHDGQLRPISVRGLELGNERARFDRISDVPDVSVHPKALRHNELPPGLRETAIADHERVLNSISGDITICVLSYEAICNDHRTRRRIVLDGNHRLAAARRLRKRRSDQETPLERDGARKVHVLEFLISETERVDGPASVQERFPGWRWEGFTPDIEGLRSAWAASRRVAGHGSRQ